MEASTLSWRIRFGRFEVDPESCELYKDGRRVRLQGQPIQILLMLLEKPGHLVTREELQQRLWPKDTFVDFDYGLNAAIKRLRESLGDSADEPLYIETLPRRGYRFIFPVEGMPVGTPHLKQPPSHSLILRIWQTLTQAPTATEDYSPTPGRAEDLTVGTVPEEPEPVAEQDTAGTPLLTPDQRLGPYQVVSLLGKGGMGEVYLAHDARLDRQVALKVLPEGFTRDPEKLARFEREAKLLASLNYPNIAAIYGLEEVDGRRFLVLELVEGVTLAEQLESGPLPVEAVLAVCRQIAEGLEAAHEKGIIHRDLKPANIKITPEEKVKILDFGLARACQKEGPAFGSTKSPVITDDFNGPAVIVGTAAYMSPEQASGKPIDKRADIWAFGCVLFECLTGTRPFIGDNTSETIAKILEGSPDWQTLPTDTPLHLCRLLRWCLQKDPSSRLRDIGDARHEFVEALGELSIPGSTSPSLQMRVASHRLLLPLSFGVAAAALIAGLLIGPGLSRYFRPPHLVPAISHIKLEPGHRLGQGRHARPWPTAVVISPDGERIIYGAIVQNANDVDKPMLFLRHIGQLHANPIKGTEGAAGPFMSPDGLWVGFCSGGRLMKVPIEGGAPTPLCSSNDPMGASWGADGTIVFSPFDYGGLFRIPSDGGNPEVLTQPQKSKGEYGHRLPHWLPDGKHLLFTIMAHPFDPRPNVAILDLQSRTWRVLIEDAADARLTPTGHLVLVRRGTLMAVRFDLNSLQTVGRPVPILEDLMQSLNNSWDAWGSAQYSISETGTLAYAPGGVEPDLRNSLVWVDKLGKSEDISAARGPYHAPRLSPDGKKILYWYRQKFNLWVYDIATGAASLLTTSGAVLYAIWKPGGKVATVAWAVPGGMWSLYDIRADGSGQRERLSSSANPQIPGSWSPDGKYLAFAEVVPPAERFNIFIFRAEDKSVRRFSDSQFVEYAPEISPDGHWLAYRSNESGRWEVYVAPFPGPGPKVPVSVEGGSEPFWARSGKQIFFTRGGKQMWAADVIRTEPIFQAGKPHLLFEHPGAEAGGYTSFGSARAWDISLDDRYFLATRESKEADRGLLPVTELILVQNWLEELKRLCPPGNR